MTRQGNADAPISVFRNILQQRVLLMILVVSLATAVISPLRSYLIVLPFFGEKLLDYTEEEAQKTANFLAVNLISIKKDMLTLSPLVNVQLNEAMNNFGLEKIKLFNSGGKIIYSTDVKDIGTVNQHEYFHLTVAKGIMYSKIVSKDHKTLEGSISSKDVAEIYVPVLADGTFLGAFELYYDLTERKKNLDRLLLKETFLGTLISCFLFLIVCIVLLRASRASIEQQTAEKELRRINTSLKEIVAEKTRELVVTQEASIHSLAILAENYDVDTGEHINRIRRITLLLGQLLKENSQYSNYLKRRETYVEDLALASILHDIGKTSVSQEILAKPAKLTEDEFDQIKRHTVVAGNVLYAANQFFVDQFNKDSYLALAADIAMYHHEKWDGTGYPEGLKEQDIPLSARIVAIADVYDALCSDRPYKKAWPHEEAVKLIISESGKHFDPELIRVFSENVESFRGISEIR